MRRTARGAAMEGTSEQAQMEEAVKRCEFCFVFEDVTQAFHQCECVRGAARSFTAAMWGWP